MTEDEKELVNMSTCMIEHMLTPDKYVIEGDDGKEYSFSDAIKASLKARDKNGRTPEIKLVESKGYEAAWNHLIDLIDERDEKND